MVLLAQNSTQESPESVLTNAVYEAAERLSIKGNELAAILGLSPATITRMKQNQFILVKNTKPWELSVMLVRLFRSLDSISNGDEATASAWLHNSNDHLHAKPIDLMFSADGLSRTLAYVDAYRAPL